MLRILLLVAAIVLLLWLIGRARRGNKPAVPPAQTRNAPRATAQREAIVACAHCGVHLPRGEAVESHGELFCGDAHRLEHEKRR